MLAVVRIRGHTKVRRGIEDTMKCLHLSRVNTVSLVPESKLGMVKKIQSYVTWGELSQDLEKKLKSVSHLKPPKGGYKSIRTRFPKGDLGYRGEKINNLISRML